ncbi:RnfABCDGE type electron transport complex subunit D [Suttonella ornithocola]|uniref:Na(+)-translocating NADH-quinone reductase subunit B n=1 Tax=Suttonella ornithocola TaxID=279832 RepID=A0A380MLD2_9GAMM|nr:RnfABCDGE type electron transport complex subunit D [Suttonella ornithocola]SUO93440.1 Na(+)-translocating NADH-quinone reductase subunit B [Suttonella ornithocola]
MKIVKPHPIIPQIHVSPSTSRIMWTVLLALLPGILILLFTQGSRWIGLLILAAVTAWMSEAAILGMRGRSDKIIATLKDGSATLTAALLILSLPVSVSPWLVILGVAFAIIFGKQLYGGLGMNPFNPAMVGYCFLLISFPAQMGQHLVNPLDLWSLFSPIDATTSATILDHSRQLRIAETPVASAFSQAPHLRSTFLLAIAWTIGGIWLAIKRYLDWRITLTVLLSAFITATLFWFINTENYLNPFAQLMSGALIFGAWFIATDPVSAATTPFGRILYAAFIGIITICIRNLGNFPDGFAFSVLLTNAAVPILDSLTPPRYR